MVPNNAWKQNGPKYPHRTNHRTARPIPLNRQVLLAPGLYIRQYDEWRTWVEVRVKIYRVDSKETTFNLWQNFHDAGVISKIEFFELRNGFRDGNARIIFTTIHEPPIWQANGGRYKIKKEDGSVYDVKVELEPNQGKHQKIQSPIRKQDFYRCQSTLHPARISFGIMIEPRSMMPLAHIGPSPKGPMSFTVDLKRTKITVGFGLSFIDPRSKGSTSFQSETPIGRHNRTNMYMFQIPFGQLKTIYRVAIDRQHFGLAISLESPPPFFRKKEDPREGHADNPRVWSEYDTWYRQTDIVYDPFRLQTAKVTLHKEQPEIDIGRWTTYLFTFRASSIDTKAYQEIKKALQDFNIEIVDAEGFRLIPARNTDLWSIIDPPTPLKPISELRHLEVGAGLSPLPFEVRYQLEVCISREFINEYNISRGFISKLCQVASTDPVKCRNLLEYVAEQGKRVYEPTTIFDDPDALAFSPKTEIPHYCAYARKAIITPSTIYFSSPAVETTNRVLRNYSRENQEGRFLRVQFTDETFEGKITSCADKQRNDEMFTRVYRTLFNGIQIGDRHYEFLAFGNSQFRENGAYLFCPTDNLSCDSIRDWMGSFSHIRIAAKYAARLGQCFSTTRAINAVSKPTIVKIPDIERNGFTFSDGVGKISLLMSTLIAVELGVRGHQAPSAFQFRLGGCKGMLAVSPDVKDKEVHIRPSQQKFVATYNGLEIIRCAHFSPATLNRQTITILSSLGVEDEVFLDMLTEQLDQYKSALANDDHAIELLCRFIDNGQVTLSIAGMVRSGFMAEQDPFVLSLLHLWRSWSIKLLKEKARIIVENGAFLLGCMDETATLRGYVSPKVAPGEQIPIDELPQIFLQIPDKKDPTKYVVIEGICLVGRNPSLHPGDLRVVRAVNIPALYHMRDVVVFPQTGDQDIPSMCSGGDLDGDDFFVLWEPKLQPREWNCEPMNYDAPAVIEHKEQIKITDLMKFFVRFMKNDSLPSIAHSHLAQTDYLQMGVKDPKCIELANLHSKAVDYVKTGQPAEMPKRLRPGKWPHFMEKKFKSKEQIYISDKILGKLYDRVESANFNPQWEKPFDKRVLRAYQLDSALLKSARQIKSQYDTALRRILANQGIRTEFEVWSAFVLSKPRVGTDYKQEEEITRISDSLKDQFRTLCIERAGGKDFTKLGPFVAGMYKVTKEELDIALAECRATRVIAGRVVPKRRMEPNFMPLISFPWLFEKELCRIATGIDISDEDLGLLPLYTKPDGVSRKRNGGLNSSDDDFIQREDGRIIHRGEELDLFGDDPEIDSDDISSTDERLFEHGHTKSESNELVPDGGFPPKSVPEHVSGTGVEDVVPRTELDGLISQQEAARLLRESSVERTKLSEAASLLDDPRALSDNLSNLYALTPKKDRASESSADLAVLSASPNLQKGGFKELVELESDSPSEKSSDSVGGSSSDLENLDQHNEEEVISLGVRQSPRERLANLTITEKHPTNPQDAVVETEIVELEVGESSLDKLARLLGST